MSVEAMQSMKLRALIKYAEEMGVDDADLEAAEDKDQVVALLTAKLRQQKPAQTAQAAQAERKENTPPQRDSSRSCARPPCSQISRIRSN